MQYGSKNTAAKRSKYILRYYFSLTFRTQFLPKGQRWAFKWAKPMASGSQKKTVKPTFKSCCSIITQTYFIFEKKTDTLNVVFMHNVSGKVQLSFSFMCNLPFLLKLFLIQNYFFSFLFFVSQAEPWARGEEVPICCQESDTSCFTLVKGKMSSLENTRLDVMHLHSLLNKNWCLLCSFSFPIPASWSTGQLFSEQDPAVNDNYWNAALAKTSIGHPAQSLGRSGIPKPFLMHSDSRCLKGSLVMPWRL